MTRDRFAAAVAFVADEAVRFRREAKEQQEPHYRMRLERDASTARMLLRGILATDVYAEFPEWRYADQYKLFVSRENDAIERAEKRYEAARLAETAGAPTHA